MNQDIQHSLIQEAKVKKKRYILFSLTPFIIGIIWIIVTFFAITNNKKILSELKQEQVKAKREIDQSKAEVAELKKSIDAMKGLFISLDSVKGPRKEAIKLALDLQDRNIHFKFGGRRPEEGLDLSGFVDYILSQPQFDIVKNPSNCGQPCLINNPLIVSATQLSELRPGDLIFYKMQYTMIYLGNRTCIGMINTENKIAIKDVHFLPIIGYGKVTYPER